jgi:uncharacterized protein (TIGR02265 family)
VFPLEKRVNFKSGFEALFLHAFRDRLTHELRRDLLEIGLNVDHLQTAYPHAVFVQSQLVLARHLFADDSAEQGFQKIGMRLVAGYFETLIGKPLLVLLRLMGLRRTLGRMSQNFRTSNNYIESELVELGTNHFLLWMNEVGPVRYTVTGVLAQGLSITSRAHVSVQIAQANEVGTVYEIRW